MWHLLTQTARQAIASALEQGVRLGAPSIDTEHLLLGLLGEADGAATRILTQLSAPPDRIRAEVEHRATRGDVALSMDLHLSPTVKRVIFVAYEEARQLNNNYIGTEHLLLGLIAEAGGLAARVLAELGADLPGARRAVYAMHEKLEAEKSGQGLGSGQPEDQEGRARLFEPTAQEKHSMWQRFTERARRVVFFGQEEAARLGENYVGTEHLLLGLVRDMDSVGSQILEELAIPLAQVRADIERLVQRGQGNLGQDMQLTPRAKRVIDLAYEEARELNNNYIGTEHLLLGLIREGDGLAARVLVKLGADLEATRRLVAEKNAKLDAERAADGPSGVSLDNSDDARKRKLHAAAVRDVWKEVAKARAVCAGLTDLRAITDLTTEQAWALLSLAAVLKETLSKCKTCQWEVLAGKTLAMVFEKPSLRTRVSFETGMFQLGGHAIYLQPADISMGKRESVADVARNLDRMVDGIMARVFSHNTILELAEYSGSPVINGLCDREHPCQALADILTVWEQRCKVEGQKIVFVGDGNNVAHSLILLGAKLGAHMVVACPEGYAPHPEIVQAAEAEATASGGSVAVTHDSRAACVDADVIYTDVWTSMGREAEAAERAGIFAPFQVNAELTAGAKPDYLFLHCLPAHRGEEVTADVIDGPNSAVFDQAENRLHAQKAVLAVLLA